MTVAVAVRAAASSIGQMEETAVRLLAKLDQLLPSRLRKRASALHSDPPSAECISVRSHPKWLMARVANCAILPGWTTWQSGEQH